MINLKKTEMALQHWLLASVAIGISVCLIQSSITSALLTDHWKLAGLLNVIYLTSGFLSGTVTSNQTIDAFWDLPPNSSSVVIANFDFDKVLSDLEELSDSIDRTDFGPKEQIGWVTIEQGLSDFKTLKDLERQLINSRPEHIIPEEIVEAWRVGRDYNWTKIHEIISGFSECLRACRNSENYLSDVKKYCAAEPLSAETEKTIQKAVNIFLSLNKNTPKEKAIEALGKSKNISQKIKAVNVSSIHQLALQMNTTKEKLGTVTPLFELLHRLHKLPQILRNVEKVVKELEKPWGPLRKEVSGLKREEWVEKSIFYSGNDVFLKHVLNRETELDEIMEAISPMKKYSSEITELKNHWNNLKAEAISIASRDTSDLLNTFSNSHKTMKYLSRTLGFHECFSVVDSRKLKTISLSNYSDQFGDILQEFIKEANSQLNMDPFKKEQFPEFRRSLSLLNFVHKMVKSQNDDSQLVKILKSKTNEEYDSAIASVDHVEKFTLNLNKVKSGWPENYTSKTEAQATNINQWFDAVNVVPEDCDADIELNPIINFIEFFQLYQDLRNKNFLPELIKNTIKPLIISQKHIRHANELSERMSKYPFQYPTESDELYRRLMNSQDLLLDVGAGVQYLDKLFRIVDNKKNIDRILKSGNLVQTEFEKMNLTRKTQLEKTVLEFKRLEEREEEIKKMLKDIEGLEEMHKTGKWNSLASLSKIYEAAENIKGVDFRELFDSMSRFPKEAFDGSSKLRKLFNVIKSVTDVNLDFASARQEFRKTREALNQLDEPFDKFFKWTIPQYPTGFNSNHGYLIIVIISLLILAGTFYSYWMLTRDPPRRKRKRTPQPTYGPTTESQFHCFQMLQECRLEMNEMDKEGTTKLFRYVQSGNNTAAIDLIDQGAALDAACGSKARTALHESAARGNAPVVEHLLKSGANKDLLDADGYTAADLAVKDSCVPGMFAKYSGKKFERIIPNVSRDFYVLIVEREKFCKELITNLPAALDVVYGFKDDEVDLQDFTHFIIDPDSAGSVDLPMHLDNMLFFEILSKPGMIVTSQWLNACLDDPRAINDDWKFQLTNISFEGLVQENKVTAIKNDIHRLRPPLFAGASFTILDTMNRVGRMDREKWIRVIRGFGGDHVNEPVPSLPEEILYHAVKPANSEKKHPIDPTIILYFEDSILRERWTWPDNGISILGMGWLPESIVRYELIRPTHGILMYEKEWNKLPVIFERGLRY